MNQLRTVRVRALRRAIVTHVGRSPCAVDVPSTGSPGPSGSMPSAMLRRLRRVRVGHPFAMIVGACALAASGPASGSTPSLGSVVSLRTVSAALSQPPDCTSAPTVVASSALGPFDAEAESGPECVVVDGIASAGQTSTVDTSGISAILTASSEWFDIADAGIVASSSPISSIEVIATIIEPTRVFIDASAMHASAVGQPGSGTLGMELGSSFAVRRLVGTTLQTVLSEPILNGTLSGSLVLDAGVYVITASAKAGIWHQGAWPSLTNAASFEFEVLPSHPADLDGDGLVGGADLGLLLAAWGSCAACLPLSCPSDLTGDCAVGGDDLGALLAAWTG
ncbi:MAG TPA: hypothetical protein PKC43_10535 [Phycisphaerales bacterium]|nr:hypothetical protein [Phycisphaerales bacterium]HMP37872.1 hypothetical protein [Phycisphaerales bacterium]